ncbi:hypothetical protein K504DRAFT_463979 [Pleomassaria siparia CBS 279.74]|uniref:Uncharacterized protein n=1 Tax=Pleomassaria siparia CBS 279.74 TaxID=1314801 RepID=A0A6G1JR55_9PLEO|nr:hypothetical protein K504DRAFT_463979 [Pleomassaria siparia CBS 279.74]
MGIGNSPQKSSQKAPRRQRRPRKVHPRVLGPLDVSTSEAIANASPLLRLPPEIRNMIWKHALTTTDRRYKVPGIITVCHQVALETMAIEMIKRR